MRNFLLFALLFSIASWSYAQSLGTGFLVSSDGLIATSNHVIDHATEIEIEFNGKRFVASIVAQNEANDLAILKIIGDFPFLEIKGSEEASIGEEIFTVGFPNPELQGYEPKMTTGVISSMSGIKDDPTCYQISVPVQPGNSGGPLLSKNGDVLGIIKSKLAAKAGLVTSGALPENVNYAVKSDYLNLLIKIARSKIQSLTKQKAQKELPGVEKALSCIVLVKAKTETYREVQNEAKNNENVKRTSGYIWQKRLNEMEEYYKMHKSLERFDMDDPLETYGEHGAEMRAKGEISDQQALFFENWKKNTYFGRLGTTAMFENYANNPEPFEREWEVTKNRHQEYIKSKEYIISNIEKLSFMKLARNKLRVKGLKLVAEEFEQEWDDSLMKPNPLVEEIVKNAVLSEKNNGTLPKAKIVFSDATGFAFTDPTINDDTIVELTTKKRIKMLSQEKLSIVVKNNDETIDLVSISCVTGEPFITSFPKKYRSEMRESAFETVK